MEWNINEMHFDITKKKKLAPFSARIYKSIQNLWNLQGYIFCILINFAVLLTLIKMLFLAAVLDFVLPIYIKI